MSIEARAQKRRVPRHRRIVIAGLMLVVLAFVALLRIIQQSPATAPLGANTVLLHAITVLNITLLLVLLLVLGRNLIKLYVDRRRRKLGSRFSTKLVVTYIGLALVPSVLLFVAASNLIQRSVDAWFSTTTKEVVLRAREVARQSTLDQENELLASASNLADLITEGRLLSLHSWQVLRRDVENRRRLLLLDAVSVYQGQQLMIEPVVDSKGPFAAASKSSPALVHMGGAKTPSGNTPGLITPRPGSGPLTVPAAEITLALSGHPFKLQDKLADGNILVRAGVPIRSPNDPDKVEGVVVTARRLSAALAQEAGAIDSLYRSYVQGMDQKEPIATAYQLTFLLMTLLILFSALWVGLHLARGVTVPIQKLAEGTRAVASGNLDFQVEVEARDELGTLVDSFNRMTRDLRAGQKKLKHSRDRLQRTNTELEERRRYMEAVLANINTGVISMNADGQITTFNRAAERMLAMEAGHAIAHPYQKVLGSESLSGLRELMDWAKARRSPRDQELAVEADGRRLTIAAHCSSFRDSVGAYLGTVVVLDDLTELIKAQKASAWREVARRIAHEIRNPLTPIQLSAQRISRRYRRAAGAEGQYDVIEEGTRTILQEVDTLKGLVSEFSRYARMPTANLVPANLHEILEASLLSCASMHEGIRVERTFSPEVPILKADHDQLKRAFTNLFDNAVEAMEGQGTLWVSTDFDPEVEMVRVEVADSGPGIHADDKRRLFLPYFSRKHGGTGLGLAIVHQIVADHRGYVRVADNQPRGTVFIVELPR
ncbi:MAG: PAS domain-containing sensor histidine kinase [Acidobacteriota bacterium]